MCEFDEHVQETATPYEKDPPETQTNEHTAVTRIESDPRLPIHANSTVAILDTDVALRLGPGLMHARYNRHYDGLPATGDDVPVVTVAKDPCLVDEDNDDNRKWSEHDM